MYALHLDTAPPTDLSSLSALWWSDDLSVQGGTYRQFTLNVHPFHIYQQCVDKEGKVSTDTVLVVVNINPAQSWSVLLHCLSGGMDGYFLVFDFFDINVLCFHKGLGLQQI